MSNAELPEIVTPIERILELHPLPWSHHLLLIKDAEGRQVIHLGGMYGERNERLGGKYLSGLNALIVQAVNVRADLVSSAVAAEGSRVLAAASEIAQRWMAHDLPVEAAIHSNPKLQLAALARVVIAWHCAAPAPSEDGPLGRLYALRQQVEDTIAVAQTETDADGFISAYHFKTGAIHRLLAEARKH